MALLLMAASGTAQTNCLGFAPFKQVGALPASLSPVGTLHECSGLELSRQNPGVLWAHDDAGNGNRLVALASDGSLLQQYRLGTQPNIDWEDIAIGPGPVPGADYLYLADIGDNKLSRGSLQLLVVAEPRVPASPGPELRLAAVQAYPCRYPNQLHDAETLLIDPVDGRPYILTKESTSTGRAFVYSYPLPLDANRTKALKLEGSFAAADPRFSAGDVSADGWWIVIRNQSAIYAFERGAASRGFFSAFQQTPCVALATGQGNAESLCLAPDGRALFTTAEAQGAAIYRADLYLPTQASAQAAYWSFGSALPGTAGGAPHCSLDRVPRLGSSPILHVSDAGTNAIVALGFGATALPDGVLPFVGGWAHVQPALVVLQIADPRGRASLAMGTVPNQAQLVGSQLHAQVATSDLSAPQGLALSRGLSMQVGR